MVVRVILFHPYTKFEVRRPSLPEIWLIFGHGVDRSGDLDLLTFRPLNVVTGHGLPSCQVSASYALPFST